MRATRGIAQSLFVMSLELVNMRVLHRVAFVGWGWEGVSEGEIGGC